LHPGLVKHVSRQFVGIAVGTDYSPNARVYDHLGAGYARLMGDVDGAALHRYPMQGSLNDSVLLCVQAPAYLLSLARRDVQLVSETAHHIAVSETTGSSIVSRG
jgi:hypothetical protein